MTPPKCPGHNREGAPCSLTAGHGTDHKGVGCCKFHGGSTPTGRAAARRQAAEQAVVTYGLPREIDPHAALLEELHRTAGHVAWLGQKIAAFETDGQLKQYGAATVVEENGEDGAAKTRTLLYEKPAIWVELYNRERRHFAEVAKTCISVGIEERRVQLAEQQGQLIAEVLRGVLTELGVIDRPETPAIVRKHLTLCRKLNR